MTSHVSMTSLTHQTPVGGSGSDITDHGKARFGALPAKPSLVWLFVVLHSGLIDGQ